ncbi:MAG: TlpA disulfide reductase family protein [Azospirillaceae bacterium]|nr:TlpA disulfide reductase family protein [Azospirillaceae bacterium]
MIGRLSLAALLLGLSLHAPIARAETNDADKPAAAAPLDAHDSKRTKEELVRHFLALRVAELRDTHNDTFKLDSLKGKVVWINQWANWCGPCKLELEAMRQVQARVGADKLAIVLVSTRDDWSKDQDYLEDHHIPWQAVVLREGRYPDPVALAFTLTRFDKQGRGIRYFPFSSFLDAAGDPAAVLKDALTVDENGAITDQAKFDGLVAMLEEWTSHKGTAKDAPPLKETAPG